MTRLIANDALLAFLNQTEDLAEIRDASGKVIGYYAPAAAGHAARRAGLAAQIDPEEIRRRKAEPGQRLSTVEVFEHLLSITQDEGMRRYLGEQLESLRERDRCATP